MSVFAPINDDHAVESVALQLSFDGNLIPTFAASIQGAHALWRDELPASQFGSFDFAEAAFQGLAFSYMRPDGSAAWQMKFEGSTLEISCRRYTRWAKVWSSISSLLAKALSVLNAANAPVRLNKIGLQVTDRFDALEREYALDQLISRASSVIPPYIYEVGPLWHNNSGWFQSAPEGPVLVNLNLSSTRMSKDADEEDRIAVTIVHLQELRLAHPLALGDPDPIFKLIETATNHFHLTNKAVVASALVEAVNQRIGLSHHTTES